ncbi:hypothetical protein Hs30E_06480 [Lactococcus hodotermopsidis]|uniref:HicB-like antitoxin of toxin-antitoxin system domain-containing protein n=1 Tax=Pseudolactococcus hodotermopsidis TaxID=2709157 RepID=A0A6A0BE41_9LACT|nr:type II toxin-antitoxin system CcdA family antitoxin [Lactococcus hodotermopsidis]GFH42097.1 hypothetical protein Hs30E_06480 [Lactococcus hodotermopsidis]
MRDKIVIYPAVFEKMTDKGFETYYDVRFPDVHNAWEVLGLVLVDVPPMPSDLLEVKKTILMPTCNWLRLILRRTLKVKKNTTIPADLAKQAENLDINFSSVLTKALKQEIKILTES